MVIGMQTHASQVIIVVRNQQRYPLGHPYPIYLMENLITVKQESMINIEFYFTILEFKYFTKIL
jgi:hypothetical protein